ncbi:MAG: RNA 2',3'-cyclic phosphodiesterase [Desulfovibrio sp.]|nr:RNA 2',3'-cyclic phosphodiesterase [Desulfovibrio sp.]MBI4958634.1 RNA 2',3'-cyclic phosphodiesterase [Desulfovibrio sp.]
MELARLFVGLPLPENYQRGLERLVQSLKPVVPGSCSWTRPGNWHITLAFLGDIPLARAPELSAVLAGISWNAFSFMAGGGGFFPSAKRPRVVWVGAAEGGDRCRELASSVAGALVSLGLTLDEKPFSAHLTVGRIKSSRPGADWQKVSVLLESAQWPVVKMDRFVLWRSFLGGDKGRGGAAAGPPGPRYVPLGEYGASG